MDSIEEAPGRDKMQAGQRGCDMVDLFQVGIPDTVSFIKFFFLLG